MCAGRIYLQFCNPFLLLHGKPLHTAPVESNGCTRVKRAEFQQNFACNLKKRRRRTTEEDEQGTDKDEVDVDMDDDEEEVLEDAGNNDENKDEKDRAALLITTVMACKLV